MLSILPGIGVLRRLAMPALLAAAFIGGIHVERLTAAERCAAAGGAMERGLCRGAR